MDLEFILGTLGVMQEYSVEETPVLYTHTFTPRGNMFSDSVRRAENPEEQFGYTQNSKPWSLEM